MSGKLKRIWKDKKKILEGISNTVFIKEEVEKVALHRQEICESNQCTFYDKQGSGTKVFVPGSPACGVCGCNIKFLTHSMSSKCSLWEINQDPLWLEELTQEEDDQLNN